MPRILAEDAVPPATAHEPVLAAEVMRLLAPAPGETAVDCTFGAGGHARLLAPALGPGGTYVAIDRDPEALRWFQAFAEGAEPEARFVRGNYAEVLPELAEDGLRADLVLMDLGVSSMQVDRPERGFSYSRQAPLDMRMDPDGPRTAADLVAQADEAELAGWLRNYGEERHARAIARAIVRRRRTATIATTADLVEIIRGAVPAPALFAGGHPAKRTFQALRIAVNDELASLEAGLDAAFELLVPGGRLAVISFHSLEDRIVKRFMAAKARGCVCPPEVPICVCGRTAQAALLGKAQMPRADEVGRNPRSRSARLRALVRREGG